MCTRTLDQRRVEPIPIHERVAQGSADLCDGRMRFSGVSRLVKEIAQGPAQFSTQDEQCLVELVRQSDDGIAIEIACCEFEIRVRYAPMICGRSARLGGIKLCNTAEYPGHVVVQEQWAIRITRGQIML